MTPRPQIILLLPLMLFGCRMKTFYPTIGAVAGGGVGSLGGPMVAAGAAGAGALVGEIARGDSDLEEAREEIKALTTGDVEKLLEIRMSQQKSGFQSLISGIYNLLIICGIVAGGIFILPFLYSHRLHKKTTANIKKVEQNGQVKGTD